MTPQEFAGRWHDAGFGERQGAQSFFNDLCGLVGHATPAAYSDPEAFTFEKWVPGGFADAYFEEHFGWEFKGQDAQLDSAFDQLLRYQVHLKTPPLLIVSSFETIRIQTNFPGMETARYDVGIAELEQPDRLGLVRDAFFAPQRYRERLRSVDAVTRETASLFQSIVVDMEARNEDTERLAHYLNQLVFCLYSEDAGLLPEGLFTRIVAQHYRDPTTFDRAIRSLFAQMATGGFSGADEIAHFNGDLNMSFDSELDYYGSFAARAQTVMDHMAALGMHYVGPRHPNGRQANPKPEHLKPDSLEVVTYHTVARDIATAHIQLDHVFASHGLHEAVTTRAMNEIDEWGSSDHCRIIIDVE